MSIGQLRTSPSVDASLRSFDSSSPVPALDLVTELLKHHPEYGRGLGGRINAQLHAPETAPAKPAFEWIDEVTNWVHSEQYLVELLHGRLLIQGLSKLDPHTAQALLAQGFLKALRDELGELPRSTSSDTHEIPSPETDQLRMLKDSVEGHDTLNRKPFAEILTASLDLIRADLDQSEAFLLHIDGPWGSGKSTMMRFLADELRSSKRGREPWVVVEFNAWQHQREDPPWWSLREAIADQGLRDVRLGAIGDQRPRKAPLRLRIRERMWRIGAAVGPTTIGVMVLLVGIGALLYAADQLNLPLLDEPDNASWLNRLLAAIAAFSPLMMLAGVLYPLGLAAAARLTPSSGGRSKAYLASRADPLSALKKHLADLMKWIGKPTAIFIDDIDRCEHGYVVSLLEGIQTLFIGSKAVFVVSCDRRWIEASYDATYAEIRYSVEEPGRSLGNLFLAKAFQVSVELPPIGRTLPAYWAGLLDHPDEARAREARMGITRQEIQDTLSESADFEATARERAETDPELAQEWRVASIIESLQPERAKQTEKALWHFHPYVERNPRAMKRLVNAVAIQRAAAEYIGAFDETDLQQPWRQLVLWLILGMRWPRLAAAVRSQPELLLSVIPPELVPASESRDTLNAPKTPISVPDDSIVELLNDPEVRHVIIGDEVGVPLLPETVRVLVGLPIAVTVSAED